MLHCIVGLGANLGDPRNAFVAALSGLAAGGEVIAVSHLWRTRPVGPPQPDFVNAAVLIAWPGDPDRLLHRCRQLETAAGRDRASEQPLGPRSLDLDILVARDLVWRSPELDIPHLRFHERPFALVPASEIAPDWIHPLIGRRIAELAAEACAADPEALVSSEDWQTRRRP
jgi:2-amino-4-hydroxy-6-hydroxymethyldihydropteridine diphosphokinase